MDTEIRRYRFARRVHQGLLDEIAAEFGPVTPAGEARLEIEQDGSACYVRCTPEQFARVASLVQAHDPVASRAREAATMAAILERSPERRLARLEELLARLEAKIDAVASIRR